MYFFMTLPISSIALYCIQQKAAEDATFFSDSSITQTLLSAPKYFYAAHHFLMKAMNISTGRKSFLDSFTWMKYAAKKPIDSVDTFGNGSSWMLFDQRKFIHEFKLWPFCLTSNAVNSSIEFLGKKYFFRSSLAQLIWHHGKFILQSWILYL